MSPIRNETCETCQAFSEANGVCLDQSQVAQIVIIETKKGETFVPNEFEEIIRKVEHKGGAATYYVNVTFWPKTTKENPACGKYRIK